MRGPGSFSLERLLAIYRCIVRTEGANWGIRFGSGGSVSGSGNEVDMPGGEVSEGEVPAEALLQLASLVRSGQLARGGSDPLDVGAKYWCRLDKEDIRQIAALVNFPLGPYLRFG